MHPPSLLLSFFELSLDNDIVAQAYVLIIIFTCILSFLQHPIKPPGPFLPFDLVVKRLEMPGQKKTLLCVF